MTDLEKIKADAEIIAGRSGMLLMPLAVTDVLWMVSEIDRQGKELSSIRGSCEALGEDLKKSRRRCTALHRALSWMAHNLDLALVGKPSWLVSTLKSVLECDSRPIERVGQ